LSIVHAAPTPNDNTELISNLITTSTQIKRYRKLLTDPSGTKLLGNEELAKATVHDFTQDVFNVTGAQGGVNGAVSLPFPSPLHTI
jgi:tartrate dehydratase beta subunit/fumarate hydratase class I family protein